MFTGIIEEVGEIESVVPAGDNTRLTIRGNLVSSDAKHGDSIAVNGVCLTVITTGQGTFVVDAVPETLVRSSLANVAAGQRVNLERAAAVGQRLGGHIVQGHVDGTGTFLSRDEIGLTRFSLPASLRRYVVEKGSITINGTSLTVVGVTDDEFSVALIPTTLTDTVIGDLKAGDVVNLEADVIAKYLEKLAAPHLGGQEL